MTDAATVPRILVLGDVMTDIIARPQGPIAVGTDTLAQMSVHAGGSGANQAAWLGSLGLDVHFIGCIGDDAFGALHAEALTRVGVALHLAVDDDAPTGLLISLVDPSSGERSMLTQRGANLRLAPRHLPVAEFQPGAIFHLSGYSLVSNDVRPAALAALDLARTHGMRFTVDPASASLLAVAGPDAFLEWTRGAALSFPNLDEARLLSGESEPEAAAYALCRSYGEVVIKLGAAGALWARADTPVTRLASETVAVVDTTGAGDAFCAGFLDRWLRGAPPADALAMGVRLGALAASHVGARPPNGDLSH